MKIPCFFHPDQLRFAPRFEWFGGERTDHPETSVRGEAIVAALESDPARFTVRRSEPLDETLLRSVHDPKLLRVLQAAESLSAGASVHPSVFLRGPDIAARPERLNQAGAFCFDTGTPLHPQTWSAAKWSAASAVCAALCVAAGDSRVAYGLARPPGHHATPELFGGYCYLANASLAARALLEGGATRVAILDIDVHHGNGTQAVFWNDPRVLTVSLHGDPESLFPFFTGYADETGGPQAPDANLNLPLPSGADGRSYMVALETALERIVAFDPAFVLVAAGVDTHALDPIGNLALQTDDLNRVGARIGALGRPTVVIQEGGYYTPLLGENVTALLLGVAESDGVVYG